MVYDINKKYLMRTGLFLVIFICIVCFGCASYKNKPHVFFILIDTLRSDHISGYGYERKTTPNLDRFEKDFVVFEKAYSPSSWTLPSTISMFTGVYPSEHGTLKTPDEYENRLVQYNNKLPSMTKTFKENNYLISGFISNPWIMLVTSFIEEFDYVEKRVIGNTADGYQLNKMLKLYFDIYLKRDIPLPVFSYIHYMEPHGPYVAPGGFNYTFNESLERKTKVPVFEHMGQQNLNYLEEYFCCYDNCIFYADFVIEDLISYLKAKNLYNDSLIVIVSDHGEEFYEHGGFDHGRNLYREVLQVPLYIKFPQNEHGGKRIKKSVPILSIFPTIVDYLDLKVKIDFSTKSLMPYLGDKTPESQDIFTEADKGDNLASIIFQEKYHMIINKNDYSEVELYDIEKDPREQDNLLKIPDQGISQLTESASMELVAFVEEGKGIIHDQGYVELTEEDKRNLQAIGYLR